MFYTGKDKNKLEKVQKEIKLQKGSTIFILNLKKDHHEIDRSSYEIFKKFNKLDILILNAGILGT